MTLSQQAMRAAILRALAENPDAAFGTRELFRHLGLRRKDYEDYRWTLHQMMDSGEIQRLSKRHLSAPRTPQTATGILRLTARGFGFVERPGEPAIFIAAREAEKAFDRDRVTVEVHDRGHEAGPEGRIVEVEPDQRPLLLGRLFRREGSWLAEIKTGPVSFHARVQPNGREEELRTGDWALLKAPATRRRYPLVTCQIQRLLGSPKDMKIAEKGLLVSFGFSEEYPKEAVKESERLRPISSKKGVRRDLREEFVVVIDPADAKDHDDAVSLRPDGEGGYHLGVHIADVSRYVPPGSAIDTEARRRAFSVYLQRHHLPMLPPRLPRELCSLKPGKERLALSVLMHLDRDGRVLSKEITPSRIVIRRLINYEAAQAHLDASPETWEPDAELGQELREMWSLASRLRQKRLEEGGVDFDLPEPGFIWEDGAAPVSMFREPRLHSHMLIEEFMLAANRAVAEMWVEKFGEDAPNVFRVHPPLDAEKRQRLEDYLKETGFQWPANRLVTAHDVAALIEEAHRRLPEEVVAVVARKALTLARYDAHPLGHFGLGFGRYLHFTSPIRRYADLTVHRLVWKYLINGETIKHRETFEEDVGTLCQHLSTRERVIADLERESLKLAGLLYLDERRDQTFPARLVEVYQDRFYLRLEDLFLEGTLGEKVKLPYRSRREAEAPSRSARGRDRGRKPHRPRGEGVRLGDRLEVTIERLDLLNRKLELTPA